jgi:hypothetical protein
MTVVMTSSDETTVPVSKRKVLLLIVGAIGFVALGLWMFQLDAEWIESQRRFNSPTLVHSIGVAAMVFFGVATVAGVRKLFDSKPGLVLSSVGVLIDSSSAGLIPWSDITRFDTYVIQKQKLLVVKLVAPEKYLRAGGFLRQAANRANMGMLGSPIAIASSTLKISFDELVTLCDAYLAKYGKARGH